MTTFSRFQGTLVVSEDDVKRAMLAAFTHLKLVVEPGGVVGLAALLSGAYDVRGKTVVVLLSGGNVDMTTFIDCCHSASANG